MELTQVLDPPATTPTEAKAPGTDPNDKAAQAFASLLAALVGGVAPTPTPTPIVVAPPTAGTPGPAATAVPVAVPVGPTAASAPALPAFSSPARPDAGRADDQKPAPVDPAAAAAVAVDLAAPVAGTPDPPAPAKPAPATHPSASAPAPVVAPELAVAAFSSPQLSGEASHGDQNDAGPPAPVAAREVAATPVPVAPHQVVAPPKLAASPPAPPAPPPAAPASPVEQVVRAVAPLRTLPDGTHHVVLELHPAELGTVRVELSIDAGTVHLGLHADTEGTSQLLHAAMPELRSQLDAAGLVAGRLAVDSGAAGRREGQAAWQSEADRPRRRVTRATDVVDDVEPAARATAAHGHVDVLL